MSVRSSGLSPRMVRAALAFGEALIPGSTATPGADEASIARLGQILSDLSPHAAQGFGAALVLLDEAARVQTGKPFRALTRHAQDSLLACWEQSAILRRPLYLASLLMRTAHFDHVEAPGSATELKVLNGHAVAQGEPRIVPADSWSEGTDLECDVVVVGTGAGGAVVGRELADRGFVVVFVEEGRRFGREDYGKSLVFAQTQLYRTVFAWGTSPIPLMMGRLVGGSTAVNGGTCIRTPDFVLNEWCETIGTDEFSPAAMAPRFEHVEARLVVGEPERRHIGPIADIVDRGAQALGWHAGPIRRNAVGCEGQGFCNFGCSSGARRSVDVAFLPGALAQGATVLSSARADRVLIENGRAVGVEVTGESGRRLRVRGKAVVVAGGAIPTPIFLLRQGLANSSGQVGRNLSLHPSAGVGAYFDQRVDPDAHIPQGYMVDEFLRDGILLLAAQPDRTAAHSLFPVSGRRLFKALDAVPHLAMFGALIRDKTRGRVWAGVGGNPVVTYELKAEDTALLNRAIVHVGEMCWAAGARSFLPGMIGADPIDTREAFARFARRRVRASELSLISYHPLGTSKMGKDRRTSVVNLDHESHDLPGLFIVDGSAVPGPPGVNPQLTIMALAARAGERIAARLS